MARGGDYNASDDIVADRAFRRIGYDYACVNTNSARESSPLTSSRNTQKVGEHRAERPFLLEHQAPLGRFDKV